MVIIRDKFNNIEKGTNSQPSAWLGLYKVIEISFPWSFNL